MTFVVSLQLDKICFVENENIKTELKHLHKKGKSLWCVGQSSKSRESPIACIDSDSDDKSPPVKSTNVRRNCSTP